MYDFSFILLDLAMNSVMAGATAIGFCLKADTDQDCFCVQISDNGKGMNDPQAAVNPFFTTSKHKHIGLGLPLFRYAALRTGGTFHISSTPEFSTVVEGNFLLSSLERPPLGDLAKTVFVLSTGNKIQYQIIFAVNSQSKTLRFTGGNWSEAESIQKQTEELIMKMFGGILSEITF